MKSLKEKIGAFRSFLVEVVVEMKKSSWPSREELISSTMVVIFSVLMLSAFVGVCDRLLVEILKKITHLFRFPVIFILRRCFITT